MTPLEQRARELIESVLPCWCIAAYTDRGLIAPDCPRCQFGEDIADAMIKLAREFAAKAIKAYIRGRWEGAFLRAGSTDSLARMDVAMKAAEEERCLSLQ